MKNKTLHILSTKILDATLLNAVPENVEMDCISFIDVKPLEASIFSAALEQVSLTDQFVAFTSVNAVNAVSAAISGSPVWNIFCIEEATKKQVQELFPESTIIDSAPTGAQLAELIVKYAPEQVVFFCGNMRLNTIPEVLKKHQIPCREIVVYNTIKTPQSINKEYDGILFYSPSGVESFFEKNKIADYTTAISIGPSTSKALKKHTENILESSLPDIKQMLKLTVNLSKNINL